MLFVVRDPETEKNHIYQNLKMKKIIKEKALLPQTHDSLFHTLLGLMDIETRMYQKNLDLTAK